MPAIPPSSAGPVAGVIVPPPAPAVTVFSPSDSIGPYVPVRFTVADPNNARVSVKIRFSVAGAAFRDATPAPTSDSVTDLPAPNVEADYRFIWNAKADVGATASPVPAQLEFAPTSSSGPGAAIATSVFQVDTKPKHAPAALPRPVAAPVLSFDIVSGSGQKGIGGQWLPQKVQVVLHDAQANKITGVAVRFTAGGAVAVDIERDPSQPFVTDWSGVAGVRVRVRPGATGSGWIQAGIVGMPGVVSQTIPFTVTAPVIYHNLPPNVKFLYGTANGLTVDYNDAANNVVYYEADPLRPVRFKLEGVSCLLSHSEISLPHDAAKLSFVPTIFTGNAQIRVLDPVSGTVLKTIPVSVDTPVTHRTARASGPQPWNPVQLRLKVVSGLTAPTQPQVGYPGLMLLQGFALQIDDGVTRGAYASVPSAPSFLPCAGPGPSSSPLLIDYDARGSGTLAPSTTANAKPQIQALSGKSVFFIPSGEGPWFIRARVNASILDTSPLPVAYPDPTDPTKTVCYKDHSLFVDLFYTFIIQKPAVKMVAVPYRAPTDPALTQIAIGDSVQFAFGRISPVVVAAALKSEPVTVEALRASGAVVEGQFGGSYTGLAIPFTATLQTATQPGGMVVSEAVMITRGQPAITVSTRPITVIPSGIFHATGGGAEVRVPVPGPVFGRFLSGDREPVQESPVGSSMRAGAAGTLLAHSGEFAYTVSDFDVVSRAASISFARTFRSGNRVDGVLGPGWFFQHGEYLEVSGDHWAEWITGAGSRAALYPGFLQRGFFFEFAAHPDITADQSAYEIMDAHRNELHFHPDGALRFLKDRHGNRTTYDYNEKGLPIRISDPLRRQTLLSYYQKGDPVAPQTYGKLKLIHDPFGREVNFTYYPAGDPHGQPGWLMRVDPPKATVVVGGVEQPGYSRSETYWYEAGAPTDRLDGKLICILDSEKNPWITNHYRQSDRRVESQDTRTGSYSAVYDLSTRTTTVTDRENNKVDYRFPESANQEASAPDQITQYPNGRPAATNNVYALRYNQDGLQLSVAAPSGTVTEHVYDDTQASARSRGNLLAVRSRAPGSERIWSYEWDPRYNFVNRSFPPRGNAPGENPWPYSTVYVYDYQLALGDQGNVVEAWMPRTLNWAAYPDPSGLFYNRWMDENPIVHYTWNKFGLLASATDEGGVVTDFAYYPESDPTGQSAPAPSAGEGGFIASMTRDTRTTHDRDRHFQGIPPLPLTTKWRYSPAGDLYEVEDPAGIISRTVRNAFHEVTQSVERAGRPDAITVDLYVNEYGERTRTVLHQSNPDPEAGGSQLIEDEIFDPAANALTHSATVRAGASVPETAQFNAENNVVQHTPPATGAARSFQPGYVPPAAPSTKATIDEAGRAATITEATNSAGPLQTSITRDDGKMTESITGPDGTTSNAAWNGQQDLVSEQDIRGAVLDGLPDGGGSHSRVRFTSAPTAGAAVGGFTEERVDEWGRRKRVYVARFLPVNAGPVAGAAYKSVPEYFPAGAIPWPPPAATTLKDGPWGVNDGRTTADLQYDVFGKPVRFVNDELNLGWMRRDPHGRVRDWSDGIDDVAPYQNLGHAEYDVPGLSAVFTSTEHSSDPTAPLTRTFAHKELYDPEGRVVCSIDGEGRASYSICDETGHLFQTYDAMGDPDPGTTFQGATVNKPGNVTTYLRDGLGRIREIITDLTNDGVGGHPLDPNRTYNSDSKVRRKFIYDDAGFLRGFLDHEDKLTELRYDAKGRLEKVLNSPCAASPNGPTTASRTYDAKDRVDTITDANGVTLRYTYDGAGRVETVKVLSPNIPGTQEMYFHYDGQGNVDVAEDRTTKHRCEFLYDSERLMRQATVNGGLPLKCDYDGAKRRILTTYPGGGDAQHVFDSCGRLRQVVHAGTAIASFQYLGRGRISQRVVMGVTSTFGYSAGAGLLKTITVAGLVNPSTIAYTIDRDDAGRIRNCKRDVGGSAVDRKWTLDSAGRIVGEDTHFPASWPYGRSTLLRQYDGNNVFRQEDVAFAPTGSTPATHRFRVPEERGRVVSDDSITNNLIFYDLNGNLTTLGEHKYYYDAFNRLDHVDLLGARLATYEYDALNRLVKRIGPSGQIEDFVWDGWRLLEVRDGVRITERYVYGAGAHDPLTVELNSSRHVFLHSPEGSIDGLVDPGRNVEFYHYDLNGAAQLLGSDLSLVHTRDPKSRLRLHRGLWDASARSYYFRRRWYCPLFEQFLTPDPMGFAQSANQYGFCLGDPVNKNDPMGTFTIDPLAGGAAALGAGRAAADGMLFEPLKTIWDCDAMIVETGIAITEAVTGWNLPLVHGYRHTYRSGVGKAINGQKMDYGDLASSFWNGLIGMPERIYEAASQGRAYDAGYEAMNLWMAGRTAQKLLSSGFRGSVNFAARRNLISQAALRSIRHVQMRVIALRMSVRLPWRAGLRLRVPLRGIPEFMYDSRLQGNGGQFASYDCEFNSITVYEGAFRPWDCVQPAELPAPYRAGGALAADYALKGQSPEISILHEMYHGYQHGLSPGETGEYQAIRRVFAGGVNDVANPLEYTQPAEYAWELNGQRITGAHNYALKYGPTPPELGAYRGAVLLHSLSSRLR